MMSTKYAYPAIFTPEEDGGFSVVFPDLEGCFTCGDDMADALFMAEDALALVLYGYESDGREIPAPSKMEDFKLNDGEFVNSVACDTMEYRKRFNNKAVKKTLTIPEWLNETAMAMNINFSQVLQDAALHEPRVQLYSDYTARPYAGDYRDLLTRQICSPVRWKQIIVHMREQGIDTFVELGPGKTLSGMIQKTDSAAKTLHVEDAESLAKTLEELQC